MVRNPEDGHKTDIDPEKNIGAKSSDVNAKLMEIDAIIERTEKKLRENEEKASLLKKNENIMSSSFKKKIMSIASVMLLAVIVFTSSTYAYFTATVDSNFNVIESADAKFDIVDLVYPQGSSSGIPIESITDKLTAFPGESVSRVICAVNRGKSSIYVRAKISPVITLDARYQDKESLIDPSLISYGMDENYWVTRDTFDGYYYYILPLASGEKTTALIDSVKFSKDMGNMYKGSTISVRAVFEIVQSSGNGTSVLDAGGWPLDVEGGVGA